MYHGCGLCADNEAVMNPIVGMPLSEALNGFDAKITSSKGGEPFSQRVMQVSGFDVTSGVSEPMQDAGPASLVLGASSKPQNPNFG